MGPGDTLWGIAQQENMTVEKLRELNPGLDPYALPIGAEVIISQAPDDSTEVYHTVSPGSTLYSIAMLHKGVTLNDLYAWNPGIDPYNLEIGSKVRVRPLDGNGGTEVYHTVSPGSTLYSIAMLHKGVTVSDLYAWNPGIDPYNLKIGSKVRVQPLDGNVGTEVYHTVSPGSTLYSIAMLHKGVTVSDLYAWNPGIDPYNLQIGSKVRVSAP